MMMRAKLEKELKKSNTKRKNDVLSKVSLALKLIALNQKKLPKPKPSPLAASSSPAERFPRPRKRAVLIGVSYKRQKYELKGTINDVKKMKRWLIRNFDFQEDNILILAEDEVEADLIPTKKNIETSMKWLMEDCRAGDSLVFYFSGHGLRHPNFDGNEVDGFDETICPVDFKEAGMIFDDQIYSTIVDPLPKDVTLHAIVDACHSGTVLDLSFTYNRERKIWENSNPSNSTRRTNGGLAITISACEDDQVAVDTDAFSKDLTMSGALTYTLTSNVKEKQEITYGQLLDSIYTSIQEADRQRSLANRIFKRFFTRKLLQKPQLSASEPFDVYEKQFIL
ncbi:metacaspase-1-like [Mercurialis annua]|uniref:metacaspase-1-like n=1 Tax=Mercurialis annua TaxID=3986 RepID=UPI0021609337|nr:metacaspase-1-like [Mercurialis annua]